MSLRISAIAMVVLGVGCVNGDVDEPAAGVIQQDVIDCDEFMCGTNSPQIAQFGFWELNLPPALGVAGAPNNAGVQVLGFRKGTDLYLPKVDRGRLLASRPLTVPPYTAWLSGSALVDGYFLLRVGGKIFELKVSEVGSVASWAQPASGSPHVMLESYKLDWGELVSGNVERFQNVCKHPPGREDPESLGMTGQFAFHTLLFEGDRIDAIGKRDTGIDRSWFNLGCAGSALAKMALTGHTEAASDARTFITTLAERQTMLKMLAADYCGDGTPFTVGGQPLNWEDDHGTMKLAALIPQPPLPLLREARWKETGAVCLDKPRVDVHPTVTSTQVFGTNLTVYEQVKNHCPSQLPPQCAGSDFDIDGYHLLSATP
jgi:ADYC domain